MSKYIFIHFFSLILACHSTLFAAGTLISLEIIGPALVNEGSTTAYTCAAHYSDGSTAIVTTLAVWSVLGSVNTGVWINDLDAAKSESENYDIPMVYIWGVDDCGYCDDLDSYINHPDFQQWMAQRQIVMASVSSPNADAMPDKDFAKYGQGDNTLYDYPFVAIYWESKSVEPFNFTGRYDGDDEEQQFISEIESYISEYTSGPANNGTVDNGELTANMVSSNSTVTIRATWSGLAATKQVTILDTPEPRMISDESFERDFGAWTDSAVSDFDWTRKSGPTPSDNTGPSGALDGNYYIYTEASDNHPSKTAAVEAPFNLSVAISPALVFDYHMYGDQSGSLNVDVYDGTSWTLGVWSLSGQQQAGYSSAWGEAVVDLSAFTGVATIRVRGVTADGYKSDMAVDNIRFADLSGVAPFSFSSWLSNEGVPAGEQGESDDPAGDGIGNLLKYACGIPAYQFTTTIDLMNIVPGATPDVFAVRYFRDKTATDAVLDPIWAVALSGPWLATGVTKDLISDDGTIQEWRGSIPLDGAGFIRLRATSIP